MAGRAYVPVGENKDEKKVIEVVIAMEESKYDRIERETESGIKLCMEFPKRTEINGEKIVQEVKDILSGALRENLKKASGDE